MELAYGLGLRASDPVTRDKFYKLWNNAIPPSLFERLKHVIMGQNWEEMGSTFWLKQAVVSYNPLARESDLNQFTLPCQHSKQFAQNHTNPSFCTYRNHEWPFHCCLVRTTHSLLNTTGATAPIGSATGHPGRAGAHQACPKLLSDPSPTGQDQAEHIRRASPAGRLPTVPAAHAAAAWLRNHCLQRCAHG